MSLVGSWISYTDFRHCTNYFICVFPHSSLRLRIGIILDSLYPSVITQGLAENTQIVFIETWAWCGGLVKLL